MTSNQFERVAGILRTASYARDTQERLDCLRKVRELIISHDRSLLDSFFEEVVAFQHYANTEVRKFIIKFIEDACLIDASFIQKSIGCLSHLFNIALHSEPPYSNLLRSVIATLGPLYSRALTRAVKSGFIESGAVTGGGIQSGSLADTSLETFRSVIAFKDEVIRLLLPSSVPVIPGSSTLPPATLNRLCANISDAARADIIKFIEVVIVQQSRRTPMSVVLAKTKEITLDQIPDMPNSLLKTIIDSSTAASSATQLPGICLVRPRRLADEAERLVNGLANLPLKQGDENALRSVVTSPVFDAIVDSLISIARQRPQFFDRALQAFETIHVNLPPHFTQTQVGSARQKLKSALICLLRHPATTSEFRSRIMILLSDLGVTQQEISGVLGISSPPPPLSSSSSRLKTSNDFQDEHNFEKSPSARPEDQLRAGVEGLKRPHQSEASAFGNFGEEEDDEDDEGGKSRTSSTSTDERNRFSGSSLLRPPLSKKPKKQTAASADGVPSIEDVTGALVSKLTPANVADLVLLSMVTLPGRMPAAFNATYTPIAAAGTATQVRHLARLLAAQLVVWVTGEDDKGINKENRSLLAQLLEESPNADADASATKKSGSRSRKTKVDEDDEVAFMKEHAARVHNTAKPMNISVVGRSGSVGDAGGGLLMSPTAGPPTPLFNPTVPPPLFTGPTKPPISTPHHVTPARPFSLEAVITALPIESQRSLARDAYLRILCEDVARNRAPVSEESLKTAGHPDLPAQDAARIKLLCRLPSKRFGSGDLFPLLINHAMQNLKEGFELLTNLLMHVYSYFRGFMVAGALGDDITTQKSDDTDETRLLLESQRQLRALQARVCAADDDEEEEGKSDAEERAASPSASVSGETKPPLAAVGGVRGGGGGGGVLCEELSSFAFYDAVLTDILNRLSDVEIKETYFGRFMLEAPLLTPNSMAVLKRYCTVPEQAPFGFQVLRSLIELRQTDQRKELLDLLLSFCSIEEHKIRKAALKATCQLADSQAKWEKLIEDHATAQLKNVLSPHPTAEMFATLLTKPTITPQWTDEACQACAHLLLGLMPRNPGKLLLTLAEVYVGACDSVRRSLLRLVDTSICEIGLHSPHLLHLIDNCPVGAETLVTRMIHILTDPRTAFSHLPTKPTTTVSAGRSTSHPNFPVMPPPALVESVRRMYMTRVHDVRCLIPVIVGLTKQEVISALPKLVQLNEKVLKEVISRLLHASVATLPAPDPRHPELVPVPNESVVGPVTPEELLVAIHLLEFAKDPNLPPSDTPAKPYIEIRVILQACLHCFAERQLYTQERLSAAIGQLLDRPVLPTLFIRTVMQALALYPRLAGYVINVLFRLIQKQVWKSAVLWDGFIRCCVKTQPQSYQVLLQLPPQQLQSVFAKEPTLRAQVRRYVDNFSSAQRTHISRAVFDVLEREASPMKPATATTSDVSPAAATTTPSASATPVKTPTEQVKKEVDADTADASPLSSGSATPVRDEVEEKTFSDRPQTTKLEPREGGDEEKEEDNQRYTGDSLSPPSIVTNKPSVSAIKVLIQPKAPAFNEPMVVEEESYSPPLLHSTSRASTKRVEPDDRDGETASRRVRRHAMDEDKPDTDKERLEVAASTRHDQETPPKNPDGGSPTSR